MPDNEAERVAQQRAREKKAREEQERLAQSQQFMARLRKCVQDLETDIPIVLRLLAERGYPNIEEVRVVDASPNPITRLFGGIRTVPKGDWRIGKIEWDNDNEGGRVEIYLLSDGRIYAAGWRRGTFAPQAILDTMNETWGAPDILPIASEGIHGLRSELESA